MISGILSSGEIVWGMIDIRKMILDNIFRLGVNEVKIDNKVWSKRVSLGEMFVFIL